MRKAILLVLLFSLGLVAPLQAQEEADRLEQLVVDIWPDYDRAAVLILLTGRLPAAATLPASVTIPLPQEATIHAVASIADDNQMFETTYSLEEGQLRLTVPEQRFRVEYYVPYEENGLARSFIFDWQAALTVDDLNVSVQRPRAATTMTTVPEAGVVGSASDGLQYHDFVKQPLPAGERYSIRASYTLSSEQLTAPAAPAPAPESETAAGAPTGRTMNWPLFLGGGGVLFIVLALIWYVWGQRPSTARPPRKPPVLRSSAPAAPRQSARPAGVARFCHNCGAEAQPEDRFCRVCGAELKR